MDGIVAASAVIDFALAWAIVLGAGKRSARRPIFAAGDAAVDAFGERVQGRIGMGRVLAAAAALSVFFFVKWAALDTMGIGLFGMVSLAYADVVIVTPLIGLAVLTAGLRRRSRRRVSVVALAVAWASLLLVPLGVFATFIEPFRLQLETATFKAPAARAGATPLRIGVLTDIQTPRVTDYELGAIDRLMAEKPDIIVIPGDIYQGPVDQFESALPGFRDLFRRLSAPGGIYCVLGDVDWTPRLLRMFEGTPIRLLVNEVATTEYRDRRLAIGGTQLHWRAPGVEETVRRMEDASGSEDIRILVSHRPDVVKLLRPDSRIDLVIAGHTHGGQIVLPFFGPPVTLTTVPRTIAAGGLHDLCGNAIYVSRGVGCERNQAPRIRFLCPPEISIVTLE